MKAIEDDDKIEVMQYDFFSQKEREIANEAIELEIIDTCYLICDNVCDCVVDDDYGGFFWSVHQSSGILFESIEDAKCFIKDKDLGDDVYIQTNFKYGDDIFEHDFDVLESLIRICKIDNIINS